MITITSLPKFTAEQVFNYIRRHLLKQGKRAIDPNNVCQYRTSDGKRCAAGCLVTKVQYDKLLKDQEGVGWGELIYKEIVPKSHCDLIEELQHIHDQTEPYEWRTALEEMAEEKGFKITPR